MSAHDAGLIFEAVDGDADGAITLGDLNDGARAAARAEAGLPDRAGNAAASANASRATTPSKRQQRRYCYCHIRRCVLLFMFIDVVVNFLGLLLLVLLLLARTLW